MTENVLQKTAKAVKNWWLLALLGIGLVLLGLWVFRNPGGTLLGLARFFTIMLFISSAASMVFALTNRDTLHGWGWNLAGGVLELFIAIILLRNPGLAGLALNFVLGFWVMFRGTHLISMSVEMRNYGLEKWGMVMFGGILATFLAFCILVNPLAGVVTIAVWAGMSLVMAGVFTIFVAFALKNVKSKIENVKDMVAS